MLTAAPTKLQLRPGIRESPCSDEEQAPVCLRSAGCIPMESTMVRIFLKYLNTLTPQMDVLLCSQETVPFLCSSLSLHSGYAKVTSLLSKSLGHSPVVNEGWVAAGK